MSPASVRNAWHERVSVLGSVVGGVGHGRAGVAAYSHRHSPKKFTQHQLFACLVLKSFLKTDYRGVVAHLADCPSLVETLGLTRSRTTRRCRKRRGAAGQCPARRLLDATVREHLGRKRRVPRAAIDSTGLESSAASGYFVRRRDTVGGLENRGLSSFSKLGVVCDVRRISSSPPRGPRTAARRGDFRPLVTTALRGCGRDRGRRRLRLRAQSSPCSPGLHVRSIIPAKRPAYHQARTRPLPAAHANAV